MLNAEQSQKAKEFGKVFKAMSKLAHREASHLKMACICIMKGSNLAVVCDGLSLVAVNVGAFENAAAENVVEAYETASFYAGLKMIEYTNCFVLVGKKMYEKFVSAFTDGLSGINTSDFEYVDWVNATVPKWEDLTNHVKGVYDPKIVALVNNVIDAYFDNTQEHFEDKVYENKTHGFGIAIFDNLLTAIIFAKRRGEDYQKEALSRGNIDELNNIAHFYKHPEEA